MKAWLPSALANAALVLASCLATLVAFEAGLRRFHPHYEDLATAMLVADPNADFVPIPNNRGLGRHGATGEPLPRFTNRLGSHQHRNFSREDLESSVNIGFFGDSFTENIGIAAQYIFTEPLDYLLNLQVGSADVEGGLMCSTSAYMATERRSLCCATRTGACGKT